MKSSLIITLFAAVLVLSSFKGEKNVDAAPVAANTISGSIMDKETGEFLAGVEVELEGTSKKVYTDFDGNYSFSNVKDGVYKVKAHLISYKEESLTKVEVANASSKKMDIKLDQAH
ncbi:carboxypeptidase-like regulatory domain-containing protein [Saccharicrinis aurantiacus]|uniref:carboxypeptidase-like regulatory domain-containing protein n=1 Tax=Saccharicrinis aurantiacus TaxID=1849719 RepID=UPI00094FDB84|nr:carboxypeptidase-like regulatory domain-containing protein [Saccharicrinis aurantiacus]